ncbi:MAG: DUF4295 family protein [Chitinophagales bacterium]|nr:DUF4295 family protein [Chitinophagales bacterium]HAE14795.1 DUF4295 domain-containing protein [Bacteroidota bacterium]MCB9021697.1 DUF4295 family protein [Chitinophagales bacterium]MCB9031052.1 DUF4295 family protein [Chitinophagales bacterium]HAE34556.1 DUF4295 domain-containing protein [Bacteroidota bacterium]
MGKVSKNARVTKGKVSGGGKEMVKVIVTEKSPKTGAYIFKERIVHKDKVQDVLKGNA